MMKLGHTTRARVAGMMMIGALVLGAAACSKTDSSSTTTTSAAGTSTSAAAGTTPGTSPSNAEVVKFDKSVQKQLQEVGCYTGKVDGIIGPETDAAIVAFQTAEGLEVDGELGPETETALTAAVKAGKKVCGGAGTTSTTAAGGTTSTTSAKTTTTTGSGTAPCTATAIAAVLPSGAVITNYVCTQQWAAGSYAVSNGGTPTKFVLQSNSGAWAVIQPCGAASAGLPPVILENGC